MKNHIILYSSLCILIICQINVLKASVLTTDSLIVNLETPHVEITGELKKWHKVSLTIDGPYANESDCEPNPFTDYNFSITLTHESGIPIYHIPGYFAADGNAGESGAKSGNKWRVNFSPNKTGNWTYQVSFKKGKMAILPDASWVIPVEPYDGCTGSILISDTDKKGRDFRSKGRLQYVDNHFLQFEGNKEYYFKIGTDSPETFLGYEDFDDMKAVKKNVPLKSYERHICDWHKGNPCWKQDKGKGIIGALNYLSSKGLNSFSFLTYNAGGDGDNVWPFVDRDDQFHYDCSKLDQWGIVFDYAQSLGLHAHFKTQETENDDLLYGHKRLKKHLTVALDDGAVGPARMLYYRELIARFSYLLALTWDLGEENTQPTNIRKEMANLFYQMDPYHHNIVLHTFPDEIYESYFPLLGTQSKLTGISIQTSWDEVHKKTLDFIKFSDLSEKPWVIVNEEQNPASKGVPCDPNYENFKSANTSYTIHDIRKQTLWGNLMAGGAGVSYYFGYKYPQNDINCEDFRSRDKSWEYCNILSNFLKDNNIPFWKMKNANNIIGNKDNNKDKYCLAMDDELYVIYLGYTSTTSIDFTKNKNRYELKWFNPRKGGDLIYGKIKSITGGAILNLGNPPFDKNEDWVIVLRKK